MLQESAQKTDRNANRKVPRCEPVPICGHPICTAQVGVSADIFPDILKLYVAPGSLILDMNAGALRFWKQVPKDVYRVFAVDLCHGMRTELRDDITRVTADNVQLPFRCLTFDGIILDPPFGTTSTTRQTIGVADTYNLTAGQDIMKLYSDGMADAYWMLREKGILIVKSQDVISGGRLQPVHYHIKDIADLYGFSLLMTFVLVRKTTPIMRHQWQRNPRSSHSFFQVFSKETS